MSTRPLNLRSYNDRLLPVIVQMARVGTHDECRRVFHSETRRAFDPEFFPALMTLLAVMQERPNNGPAIAASILMAVARELQDFLGSLSQAQLTPVAVTVDLLAAPFAALGAQKPESSQDAVAVLFCSRFITHRRARSPQEWPAFLSQMAAYVVQMAQGLEDVITPALSRSSAAWLTNLVQEWRATPGQLRLFDLLLTLLDLSDSEAMRRQLVIRRREVSDPKDAVLYTMLLEQALRELGDTVRRDRARQLLLLLMA